MHVKRDPAAICQDVFDPPGATALQLKLHPVLVTLWSVWNKTLTTFVLLEILVGKATPLVFPIKAVPSPSVIVSQSALFSVEKSVNCSVITSPCSTCILSVILR